MSETMKSNDEILKVLKKEHPSLREKFKVKSIGIFGSYVRREQNRNDYQ